MSPLGGGVGMILGLSKSLKEDNFFLKSESNLARELMCTFKVSHLFYQLKIQLFFIVNCIQHLIYLTIMPNRPNGISKCLC